MSPKTAVLCCLVLAIGCTVERRPPPAPRADAAVPDTVALREIRTELERYYRAFSARDWTAFASHFWEGATLATVWQPPGEPAPRVMVLTVPEFVRQAPAGPGSQPVFEERLLGMEARLLGDLAQVWARYEARFGRADSLRTWRGIDAFTLIRHESRWRIAALAYTGEE
ncbi:MAG TPA: nuclear transport factor 2 family protein [Gemmatimonadales bacterium]|nr:nuclear transport factor 2 family protein [Gemmatimonadales bacterium]